MRKEKVLVVCSTHTHTLESTRIWQRDKKESDEPIVDKEEHRTHTNIIRSVGFDRLKRHSTVELISRENICVALLEVNFDITLLCFFFFFFSFVCFSFLRFLFASCRCSRSNYLCPFSTDSSPTTDSTIHSVLPLNTSPPHTHHHHHLSLSLSRFVCTPARQLRLHWTADAIGTNK
jgi:hypothetical protein